MQANIRNQAMNLNGFLILLIPLMGLIVIFRGGRFQWRVVPSSQLFSFICWFGWVSALVVGLLVLLGYF
jgi:hypothetical protein